MLSETEVKRLESWAGQFFKDKDKAIDIFDIKSEIDREISVDENKTILREKIKILIGDNIEKMKRIEIEMPKQQTEIMLQVINREQEKQAKLEFDNSLERIGKEKETLLLEQKFYILREYVKMVCSGNVNGLITQGEAGVGKSYNILKTLRESGKEFVYCTGFTTPLELYNYLYENRFKIVFFDDTKNIFKSEAGLEILKAALYSPAGKRLVRYSSNTTKLKAPREFIFEGGIIVAINDLKEKHNEDLKAVVDRVLYYEVNFNYEEKLMIIADLIKQQYRDLSEADRNYVFNYIKNNSSRATKNLNFRLLYKLYEIYRYSKTEFDRLAKEIIRQDEQAELIIQCLRKNTLVKDAEREFCEKTGFSWRYFYKLKARIG